MTGAVERNAVGAKTRDAMMLGALVKRIAAGIVGNHGAQVLHAEIIGPGNRNIDAVDHILQVLVVKVSVTHNVSPINHAIDEAYASSF